MDLGVSGLGASCGGVVRDADLVLGADLGAGRASCLLGDPADLAVPVDVSSSLSADEALALGICVDLARKRSPGRCVRPAGRSERLVLLGGPKGPVGLRRGGGCPLLKHLDRFLESRLRLSVVVLSFDLVVEGVSDLGWVRAVGEDGVVVAEDSPCLDLSCHKGPLRDGLGSLHVVVEAIHDRLHRASVESGGVEVRDEVPDRLAHLVVCERLVLPKPPREVSALVTDDILELLESGGSGRKLRSTELQSSLGEGIHRDEVAVAELGDDARYGDGRGLGRSVVLVLVLEHLLGLLWSWFVLIFFFPSSDSEFGPGGRENVEKEGGTGLRAQGLEGGLQPFPPGPLLSLSLVLLSLSVRSLRSLVEGAGRGW